MAGPLCTKHQVERVPMQLGKKKLWVLACPKCQAEKQASPPSADPPAKTPAAAAADPPAKKKSSGWFFSPKEKA